MSNVSSSTESRPAGPEADLDALPYPARRVQWGPVAALLITTLAMIFAYAVAGLIAAVIPGVLGWTSTQTEDWFRTTPAQFVFVLVAELAIVAFVLGFIRLRRASVKAIGFLRRPRFSDAGWAFVTFGVYFLTVAAVTALVSALFHIDLNQKQELGFDNVSGTNHLMLTFISLVILPPLVEEFLFRGFLFTGLRAKMTFWWSTVITSMLFASLHLAQGAGSILWVAGIDTFLLSLFLCYLREKTGNLWTGIFLHALKNAVAFTYLYIFVVR